MKITSIILLSVLMLFLTACSGEPSSTLADQIAGTYKGMYQNSSTAIPDYFITVTKLTDTEVEFSPTNGTVSSTFQATLEEQTVGSVTSITIKSSDDILENNGTFVASTGRLSYTFHLGGSEGTNLEIFLGDKQ